MIRLALLITLLALASCADGMGIDCIDPKTGCIVDWNYSLA
jgi:hypothetical protein